MSRSEHPSSVALGFKAFDPHELLCHFVAVEGGHYADAGVRVSLLDASFLDDRALPERTVLLACGAALLARARGATLRVILLACQRPMFWIYGYPSAGLRAGIRLAGFPPGSPPELLVGARLREAGLDAGERLTLLPARDDAARVGLLRSGHVDAAAISSAALPSIARVDGVSELADIGAAVPLVSTGIAVGEDLLANDRSVLAALVAAHRRALVDIQGDPSRVSAALERGFGWEVPEGSSLLGRLQGRFSREGRVEMPQALKAVRLLGGQLDGLNDADVESFYEQAAAGAQTLGEPRRG